MLDDLHHGSVELAVANQTILIQVDLGHYLVPKSLVIVLERSLFDRAMEDSSELIFADLAITIFIKHVEGDS